MNTYLVHRWEGEPNADWYPWLKKTLEEKGHKVKIFPMPNPKLPTIESWVGFLEGYLNDLDEDSILIGHSIGCQTIMRFLDKTLKKVKKVIFVGGWITLKEEVLKKEDDAKLAKPWLEKPIHFDLIKGLTSYTCLFSDNDKFVPLSDADLFKKKLNAEIIIQKGKGHFTSYDGIKEIPEIISLIETKEKK